MKRIKLSQNKYTIVDDSDFEYLNQWKWYFGRGKYATRLTSRKTGKRRIYMHRLIMNTPEGLEIDHINGDGLDNRKINLRLATTLENKWNYKKPITNTTGYKGVTFHKRDKRYQASIRINYKQIYLGYFKNLSDAALAYNQAAMKYHGEFARLNLL